MKSMKEIMVEENLVSRDIDDLRNEETFAGMGDELEAIVYLAKMKGFDESAVIAVFGPKGKMDERKILEALPTTTLSVENVTAAGVASKIRPDNAFDTFKFFAGLYGLPTIMMRWDDEELGGK